ncbi:alkyl hydroperoxide reductase subunit AhpC [Salirhabdus euzebyi]|uniref:Alkyl hydroperoxide reductase subunit AhpC n=1 Tax=Salirhabdus euzebyi TaxID=394506 RepID=A0A841QAK4_9BACI|nr:alkyl hydroperoxide reductase subunit AhpC [Salirhabdus euzebyi]
MKKKGLLFGNCLLLILKENDNIKRSVIINGRDVDETPRVLQVLQTGGLCPANWKPGELLKIRSNMENVGPFLNLEESIIF